MLPGLLPTIPRIVSQLRSPRSVRPLEDAPRDLRIRRSSCARPNQVAQRIEARGSQIGCSRCWRYVLFGVSMQRTLLARQNSASASGTAWFMPLPSEAWIQTRRLPRGTICRHGTRIDL